ncbi:hypothetical protein ABZS84_23000 [Streptomyces sp. NPDC005481]|uniref:hypothetical protein n=1 Tax=Streptomyces sp. NPDC005481 TaxID=3154881 RepID=UPI0033B50A51
MNHVLRGLAVNTALPSELVDRLIAVADDDVAASLADRPDLSHAQAVELASRVPGSALPLAYNGRLTAADIHPSAQPLAALGLLEEGSGNPEWARLFAADPLVEHREKLAECPGLPPAAAGHPALPVSAMGELLTDPDCFVVEAAAANPSLPQAAMSALVASRGFVLDGSPA